MTLGFTELTDRFGDTYQQPDNADEDQLVLHLKTILANAGYDLVGSYGHNIDNVLVRAVKDCIGITYTSTKALALDIHGVVSSCQNAINAKKSNEETSCKNHRAWLVTGVVVGSALGIVATLIATRKRRRTR